jgi:hypothetical protein
LEPVTDRDSSGRAILALSLEHIAQQYPTFTVAELKVLIGDTLLNMRRTGCSSAPSCPTPCHDAGAALDAEPTSTSTVPILHPFTDPEEKLFERLLASHAPRIGQPPEEEAAMLAQVASAFPNHSLSQIREHYIWLWFDILVCNDIRHAISTLYLH